jgi:hypothetical protein
VRRRVIRVLRQRTVARFASYARMFAGAVSFRFVVVTRNAGLLSGEGYRVLADQLERPRPVVAILPKCLRNDGAADHEEDGKTGEQNEGRPNQMRGIAEQAAQCHPSFQRAVLNRQYEDQKPLLCRNWRLFKGMRWYSLHLNDGNACIIGAIRPRRWGKSPIVSLRSPGIYIRPGVLTSE